MTNKDDIADILWICVMALSGGILIAPFAPDLLGLPEEGEEAHEILSQSKRP